MEGTASRIGHPFIVSTCSSCTQDPVSVRASVCGSANRYCTLPVAPIALKMWIFVGRYADGKEFWRRSTRYCTHSLVPHPIGNAPNNCGEGRFSADIWGTACPENLKSKITLNSKKFSGFKAIIKWEGPQPSGGKALAMGCHSLSCFCPESGSIDVAGLP